ncbi:hypothetical protein MBLNU459_g2075t2 [Dothideomycetes sp. NU459]
MARPASHLLSTLLHHPPPLGARLKQSSKRLWRRLRRGACGTMANDGWQAAVGCYEHSRQCWCWTLDAQRAHVLEFVLDKEHWFDLKGEAEIPVSCGAGGGSGGIMMAP